MSVKNHKEISNINKLITGIERESSDYIIVKREFLVSLFERLHLEAGDNLVSKNVTIVTPQLNPDDPNVHIAVARIRKMFKISQANLAKRARMSQPDISSFEKNGPSGFAGRVERIVAATKSLVDPNAGT